MQNSKKHTSRILLHIVGLIVFVALLGFLALTKGWLMFLFLPLLLVLLPVLFIAQLWTHAVYRASSIQKKLYNLALWQLSALFMAYLAAPGAYDTPEMLLFGMIKISENAVLIALTSTITVAAFIAFAAITVWQFVLLIRIKQAKT